MKYYYYATEDDLGVLCVERLGDAYGWTPELIADDLVRWYPETIYFWVKDHR